jgi:uncharacterized protein (TIGR00369 family)
LLKAEWLAGWLIEGVRVIGDNTMAIAPHGASWERWARWVSGMSVSQRLGLRCTEVDRGRVKLVLDGSGWCTNPTGAVHGGIVIACADQAFGAVVSTVVQPGVVPATSTFTSDFLRPAFPPLEFFAVVDRVGRTLAFVSVTVTDRFGKVCNEVRGTLVVDGSSRLSNGKASAPEGVRV